MSIATDDVFEPLYHRVQPRVVQAAERYPDALTVESLGRVIVWVWTAEIYPRDDHNGPRKDDVWHLANYLMVSITALTAHVNPA